MSNEIHIIRRTLRTTALCGMLALLATPAFAQTFNPNTGTTDGGVSAAPAAAPQLEPLPAAVIPPRAVVVDDGVLSPSAAIGVPMVPSRDPAPAVIAVAPAIITPTSEPTPALAPAPVAQQDLIVPPSFTPPAPLLAQPASLAQPAVVAVPVPIEKTVAVAATPVVLKAPQSNSVGAGVPAFSSSVGAVAPRMSSSVGAVAPEPYPSSIGSSSGLSHASKAVLHKLPSKMDAPKKPLTGKVDMSGRINPSLVPIGDTDAKIASYDAVGLSIKVAKPGLDTNFELNRAYTAVTTGDNATAIDIYTKVLGTYPQNQDALFGLASIYHRNGELEKARPYYAELLKVNPSNREGLSNFLALISEEAPMEALGELAHLEEKNPDFSPIPAQEALVMSKLGYYEEARNKILRAIELSPKNFTYKYNLAIMLDQHGDYANAGPLYRVLIDASLKGEKLPVSLDALQKRYNYISLAVAEPTSIGE